ncbi:hypothetical protein GTP38_20200 [Duganella sp. FT94W]|uniref:DUF1640 domain-containing protein n=1 Tax=Duganella lactea TaxID=2692173 RepID=A0ABW9VAP9_9BURK|nr:hypothetical protein [Duganella lactea]MYM36656.1 hypothetical protein [Duganella lactea]
MPGTNENQGAASQSRNVYDVSSEKRLSAVEARLTAVEVDVAVTKANCATKDDLQTLRAEMHAGHERIIAMLYEHELEFQADQAKQRDEFRTALAEQRQYFQAALTGQRDDFQAGMGKQRDDLYHLMLNQMWKLYGFALLMLGGVYFIARYVH